MRGTPSVIGFGTGLYMGALLAASGLVVLGILLVSWWLGGPARPVALVVVAVLLVLRDRGILRFRLPENQRLVPEQVFRHGSFLGPMQFGLEMGTGMRTFVTSWLPYLVVVWIVIDPQFPQAMCLAMGFASGRLLMAVQSIRSGDVTAWVGRFRALSDNHWITLVLATLLIVSAYPS